MLHLHDCTYTPHGPSIYTGLWMGLPCTITIRHQQPIPVRYTMSHKNALPIPNTCTIIHGVVNIPHHRPNYRPHDGTYIFTPEDTVYPFLDNVGVYAPIVDPSMIPIPYHPDQEPSTHLTHIEQQLNKLLSTIMDTSLDDVYRIIAAGLQSWIAQHHPSWDIHNIHTHIYSIPNAAHNSTDLIMRNNYASEYIMIGHTTHTIHTIHGIIEGLNKRAPTHRGIIADTIVDGGTYIQYLMRMNTPTRPIQIQAPTQHTYMQAMRAMAPFLTLYP